MDANAIFNRMILTAFALSGVVFGAFALTRRGGPNALYLRIGIIAAAVVVAIVAWLATGLTHLALDIVRHMILPVLTLTLISFAGAMLLTRNSMLETMREDFVMAARAKGLPEKDVRNKHVARNALLPVVTSLVFSLAFAIDGGVIIEGIFSWPGMGQTLLSAALSEDLPLAVGAFVFVGIFVLVAHLVADVLYVFLDPANQILGQGTDGVRPHTAYGSAPAVARASRPRQPELPDRLGAVRQHAHRHNRLGDNRPVRPVRRCPPDPHDDRLGRAHLRSP